MNNPIAKGRSSAIVTEVARKNLNAFIEQHPERFTVMLYAASTDSEQPETAGEAALFGSLDAQEERIVYASPVMVTVLDVTGETEAARLLDDGGSYQDGDSASPTVVMIAHDSVPDQSVLFYQEYVSKEKAEDKYMYVLHSESIGKAGMAGKRHYLIPFDGGSDVLPGS